MVVSNLLTVEEFAEWTRLSVSTIRRKVASGEVASYRLGERIRIPASELPEFFKRNHAGGASDTDDLKAVLMNTCPHIFGNPVGLPVVYTSRGPVTACRSCREKTPLVNKAHQAVYDKGPEAMKEYFAAWDELDLMIKAADYGNAGRAARRIMELCTPVSPAHANYKILQNG